MRIRCRAFSGERPIDLAGVTIPPQALWVVGTAAVLMIALYFFFDAAPTSARRSAPVR